MSLWKMSLSGAVMIGAIVLIRALALNRLPKNTFLALWSLALIRLLIPYTLPSVLSVYSLAGRLTPAAENPRGLPAVQTLPAAPTAGVATSLPAASSASTPSMNPWTVVWLVGMAACAAFFAVAYWKCRRKFRESLPVENGFVKSWITSHPLRRTLEIRQTDRISAPLTYGVLHPVILLPKHTDWEDETALAHVLAHEYGHIRRFDAVTKLALTIALCVHWFNWTVWIMYILANRDIELSCDETVVLLFGERAKSAYALTLIRMEEIRSGLTPLCNNFSKHAIEERIVAIMKIKKTSKTARLVALALIVGMATAFATTGQTAAANAAEDTEGAVSSGDFQPNDPEEITWWTAEEYEQWMQEQKQAYSSIIGEQSWNPTEGWYTWDQERVDEAVANMEQLLEEIKEGKMVSKITRDGDTMIQFSYDPKGIETTTETGEAYVIADNAAQPLDPERLAEYEAFNLTCDRAKALYWNGKPVRYFSDSVEIDGNIATVYQYYSDEGTVDIHTVRRATQNPDGSLNPFGKLTGIEEYKAGELDLSSLFTASLESVAQGETVSENASQSGPVISVAAGDSITESDDIGMEFIETIARFAPFGVTFVKSGDFGNLYWNGKQVSILVDYSPDGKYMTISSSDAGEIKIQTVYSNDGELIGVKEI